MDDSAPLSWLIQQIEQLVLTGTSGVAAAISGTIMPLVSACFGIYIIFIVLGYVRGATQEPVWDFTIRCIGFSVIMAIGLSASGYATYVLPILQEFSTGLMNAASGGTNTENALDKLALLYLNVISEAFIRATEIKGFDAIIPIAIAIFKSTIILLGVIPFLVACASVLIVAKVGILIIAAVAPLFFAFAVFPATRQYFSAWCNSALSYALIPLLIAIVASISVGICETMLPATTPLEAVTISKLFLVMLGNLVLIVLVGLTIPLSSALSAGGISVGMLPGLGAMSRGISNSAKGSAREIKTIGRGTSSAYQGARTAGSTVKSAISRRFNSIKPG